MFIYVATLGIPHCWRNSALVVMVICNLNDNWPPSYFNQFPTFQFRQNLMMFHAISTYFHNGTERVKSEYVNALSWIRDKYRIRENTRIRWTRRYGIIRRPKFCLLLKDLLLFFEISLPILNGNGESHSGHRGAQPIESHTVRLLIPLTHSPYELTSKLVKNGYYFTSKKY